MLFESWPGFWFTPRRFVELVETGIALLGARGHQLLNHREVYLQSPRAQRYGYVRCRDWGHVDVDPNVGLFFFGIERPAWPWANFRQWDWETPRAPVAVTPEHCDRLRRITNGRIATVMAFLRQGKVITFEEFTCATLLGA